MTQDRLVTRFNSALGGMPQIFQQEEFRALVEPIHALAESLDRQYFTGALSNVYFQLMCLEPAIASFKLYVQHRNFKHVLFSVTFSRHSKRVSIYYFEDNPEHYDHPVPLAFHCKTPAEVERALLSLFEIHSFQLILQTLKAALG